MSRPALTDSQRRAVELPPVDACVTAGAGSGKTTVLVERFVRLVEAHGADPRRIAALTFTEKAADEMRARIAEAFADPDRPESVRCRARDVEFAPISTIHSFCARLLREHAIAAGVDPAFGLLDETGAALLLEDAAHEVERRRRARGEAPGGLRLLGDERAGQAVRALFDVVRSRGGDPAGVRWHRGPLDRSSAAFALRAARARLEDERGRADLSAEEARLFDEAYAAWPAPEALRGDVDSARVAAACGEADGVARRLPVPRTQACKALRDQRVALCEACEAVAGALLDEVGEREIAPALRALLAEVGEEYRRRKDEAGVLDFVDLEQGALALLRRLEAQGRAPEGAPRWLLVDEFQDTNPVQVAILRCLRRPAGEPPVPLFAVGDAKQSIYRFRGADVGGIVAAREEAGEVGRASLLDSFRSRPEVVAFHDALFAPLFGEGGPAGSRPGRSSIAYEAMTARATFAPGPEIAVEVLAVDAPNLHGGGAGARRLAEARAIARRVRAWVGAADAPGLPRTKRARGGEAERLLGCGDVAVLLRARRDVKLYERALSEEGIPFHVVRGRGFYATEEIGDLLHLLRVVHDPRDRFAVAAWMTSPPVGARDDEVLAAFSSRPDDPFGALRAAPRFAAAVATIDRLRRLSETDALEVVVAEAIETSRAAATARMQDGGGRRARNLAKTLAIARRAAPEGGAGLAGFLRRLTDLREREVDEAEATCGAPERDSVAIATVHAAKGLEWPCVVVADAGRARGGHPPAFRVTDDGSACAWRVRDPVEGDTLASGGWSALSAEDARRDEEESTRLFYVAATRAEERLLVSFSAAGPTKAGKPARAHGWAATLWERLDLPFEEGVVSTRLGDAPVSVVVETADAGEAADDAPGTPWIRRFGPEGVLAGAAPDGGPAVRARARALWASVRAPHAGLHRTPFVVTISDLLAYAASPRDCYRERVLGVRPTLGRGPALEADDPESAARDDERPPREDRLDEGREEIDGLDRAALGRAVHAALEHFDGRATPAALVEAAVGAEWEGAAPAAAREAALAMVERFAASATGREVVAAIARGDGVRREAAFHARIAFPEREPVGGLDSLLLKGTIDLWLPRAGGVAILDHKTNSPRGRHSSVEALVAHYAPQLRLYALAAERIVGRPVDSAGLLLLDPAWDARGAAVEAAVDVSGPALLEARRLCRAYAISCLTDRWPVTWREALNFVPTAKPSDTLAAS